MKKRIGMQALSVLLAVMLVSVVMVPAVSAQGESKSWIDTFDQWAGREICPGTIRLLRSHKEN